MPREDSVAFDARLKQSEDRGDHYFVDHPVVLLHPRRWHEINPFDSSLSRDESYNASARLIILSSAGISIGTQSGLPFIAGLGGLAALHLAYLYTRPVESVVESHNPLPFATQVVAPPPDDPRAASVDRLYGVASVRRDIPLVHSEIRDFNVFKGSTDPLQGMGDPLQRTSHMERASRTNFPAVQAAPLPEAPPGPGAADVWGD